METALVVCRPGWWDCGVWRDRSYISGALLLHAVPSMLHSLENEIVQVGKMWHRPIDSRVSTKQLSSQERIGVTTMQHGHGSHKRILHVSTHLILHKGYNGKTFKDTIKMVSKKSETVRHPTEN